MFEGLKLYARRSLPGIICIALLLVLSACTPGLGQPPTVSPTVYLTSGASTSQATSSPWMRFNRWGVAFEFPRQWIEWDQAQREQAARDVRASLISDTVSIPRTLLDLTAITSVDQQGGVYIGVYRFTSAVTPEGFLADRQAYFTSAQTAGILTVEGITLTTVADYPAVDVVVQRSSGGRSRTLYILTGEDCVQLQFLLFDLNQAARYEPIFKYILSTVQLAG
jgi:hypothetical protein